MLDYCLSSEELAQSEPAFKSGPRDARGFLDGVRALPTLPSVLFRFLGLVADPRVSNEQLADLIWTDPALLARAIPVANAAASGVSLPAAYLRRAIASLGRERLRSLAYTTPLLRCFETQRIGFNAVTFWERSLVCAQACETVARELGLDSPEQYYVAGLMHDIGYLLFLQKKPFLLRKVVQRWIAKPAELLEIEREVMGVDHCRLGVETAARLKLDPWIRQAIARHHFASRDSDPIELVTCIGSAFCSYKGVDFFPAQTVARGGREREMEEVMQALVPSLTEEASARLLAAMEEATRHLTDTVLEMFLDFYPDAGSERTVPVFPRRVTAGALA